MAPRPRHAPDRTGTLAQNFYQPNDVKDPAASPQRLTTIHAGESWSSRTWTRPANRPESGRSERQRWGKRPLLVGYRFGIRSKCRLWEEVPLKLAYRRFCRLGPNGDVPDHATFSKSRNGRFAVLPEPARLLPHRADRDNRDICKAAPGCRLAPGRSVLAGRPQFWNITHLVHAALFWLAAA